MIFVVSDDTSDETISKMESQLFRIEASHGPARDRGNFLRIFASQTALFKSHFVLKLGTLRSLNTRQMFKEARGFNLPLGSLLFSLAPSELVVRNILSGGVVVYGEPVLEGLSLPSAGSSSIVKSFLVSLSLSLFGVPACFISRDGTMFSLESLKWFLLDSQSARLMHPSKLADAISSVEHAGGAFILRQFLALRQHYTRSIVFSLLCSFFLVYLFFFGAGSRIPLSR